MRSFFRFIKNLLLLSLLAFGVWSYQNNPDIHTATNDSVAVLKQKIGQFITTGNLQLPQAGDTHTQSPNKTQSSSSESVTKTSNRRWPNATAKVYLNIQNNPVLRSASIDAMNAWNRTGAFNFVQTDNKSAAQIIIGVVDDSDTSAAGETSTTYNPVTGHLLRAKVNLNRYYLQNRWYGYSQNRIINTAEHELGHAIGLDHNNGVSVMYPKGSVYTIQSGDIKAVQKLYKEK